MAYIDSWGILPQDQRLTDVDGYPAWCSQVRDILDGKGLLKYISGAATPIGESALGYHLHDPWESCQVEGEKICLTWKRNNSRAKFYITVNIGIVPNKAVSGYGTAKEMWERLERIYNTPAWAVLSEERNFPVDRRDITSLTSQDSDDPTPIATPSSTDSERSLSISSLAPEEVYENAITSPDAEPPIEEVVAVKRPKERTEAVAWALAHLNALKQEPVERPAPYTKVANLESEKKFWIIENKQLAEASKRMETVIIDDKSEIARLQDALDSANRHIESIIEGNRKVLEDKETRISSLEAALDEADSVNKCMVISKEENLAQTGELDFLPHHRPLPREKRLLKLQERTSTEI